MQQFPVKKNLNNSFLGPCPACGYDRYEHIQFLYKRGLSVIQISELIHLGAERVKTYLGGIPLNGTEVHKNPRKNPHADEIQALYLSGLNKKEICDELGLTYQIVSYNTQHLPRQQDRTAQCLEAMMDDDEYLIGKPDAPLPITKKKVIPQQPAYLNARTTPQRAASVRREEPPKDPEDEDQDEEEEEEEEEEENGTLQVQMLSIEKGHPMPESNRGLAGVLPLKQMRVEEDSVLVPNGFMGSKNVASLKTRVHNAVSSYRKKNGGKFTIRLTNKGVRIWRVE